MGRELAAVVGRVLVVVTELFGGVQLLMQEVSGPDSTSADWRGYLAEQA